uniref:WAP domain-containing protein n=1 Tax=Magallana gigas TaxID=29159 RepID=A0A8W8KFI2_MAGGI
MELTVQHFNLISFVFINLVTSHSAKSVQDFLIPREKTRWLADEANYDDDDEYIKDEPRSLDLSDNVGECGPVPDIVLTGFCKKKVCSSHSDCRKKNHRCCFNGCVKTCTRQPDPPPCEVHSYIRDCSDGRSFSEDSSKLKLTKPDNQTTCAYHLTGLPYLCKAVSDQLLMNGPIAHILQHVH